MKITDLAALVSVRNHIYTVINDKSVTNRDEFKPLNQARINLDKKFVDIVKQMDVDDLFPRELTLVKVGSENYTPTEEELDNWREVFEQARNDPEFTIFTHPSVSVTQMDISRDSELRIRPAVVPDTIEITSPHKSSTKKGQLSLPLGEKPVGPVDVEVQEKLAEISKGDIKKLGEGLDNLEDQGVKLTEAVVETAAAPIQAPQEDKDVLLEKAKKKAAADKASQDPEIADAIAKQKELLKKQGRSNKRRAKKDDDTKG